MKRTKRWKGKKKKKSGDSTLYFHALQVNEKDGYGWYDIDISRDWGILYRLRKDWLAEAPEFDYRIITRSTDRTWQEVLNEHF